MTAATGLRATWRYGWAAGLLLYAGTAQAQESDDGMRSLQADLLVVKARTVALLAGASSAGPRTRRAVEALDDRIHSLLQLPAVQLQWPDADGEAAFNQVIHRQLGGVQSLAEGWANAGSHYAGDDQVLSRALASLDNILTLYNADTPRPGNWYYWLIAIPDRLGAIGLLLEPGLPEPLRARLEAALSHQLRTMELTGANAAWEARNHAYLALLQQDPERLQRSAQRIFDTVRYSADGGVREDFSYLFHGHIPYAGAYGAGFAETVAQFMFLFDDTRWSAVPARRQLLVSLLLEHFRWVIVGGAWDPVVSGRVYDSLRRADGALSAMLFLTQVTHDSAEQLRSATAAMLQAGAVPDASVAAFADALVDVAPQTPRGFRYWYTADLGAWAGDGYHVTFRQFSRRVQDYEYLNHQGARGWNLAYGFTHISRTGREWFDGPADSQPVHDIDWEHLAGTTSRIGAHPPNDGDGFGHSLNYGRSPHSGGAGLRDGGMAAFVLVPTHGDFVARKSLTFFPGGVLALGSDITSTASNPAASAPEAAADGPVHTTLLQWVTPTTDEAVLVDLVPHQPGAEPVALPQTHWLFVDGVGLCLPAPTDLWMRRQGRVLTVWVDHGVAPVGARYAYAVLPHTTADETARWAASPRVQVLHQSADAHVVTDRITGSSAAAFFLPGEAAGFTASAPAIIYLRGDGVRGNVAVQDPMHGSDEIRLSVPVSPTAPVTPADSGIRGQADKDGLRLTLKPQLGRIYRAGWGTEAALEPSARVDLSDFYNFHATVETDPQRAVFTIHLGDEPLREGYQLHLQGRQGHLVHVFSHADIDRSQGPSALGRRVVRYAWEHGQLTAADGDRTQREGDFRLLLYTDLKMATAYVSIPHFDADGTASPSTLPRDANRRPATQFHRK